MARSRWGAGALFLVFFAPTSLAEGVSENADPVSVSEPRQDLRFAFYGGGYGDRYGAGVAASASLLYRTGVFEAGPLLEVGAPVTYYESVAAVAGLDVQPSRRVRIELLADLGAHFYQGVGRDIVFGTDPGASGTTPYAGGRACLSYDVGRVELGTYADFQDDLDRIRVRYTYPATGNGFLQGGGTGDHTIGTTRVGFGVTVGGRYDLF